MKTILDGESATRSTVIDVEKKTAQVVHCWKKDRDAQRYQLTFNYHFDVELTEVYRLAALWVNKDFQNRMRSDNFTASQLEAQEKKVISITEMYAKKERVAKSPAETALSAFAKLDANAQAALLEQLLDTQTESVQDETTQESKEREQETVDLSS